MSPPGQRAPSGSEMPDTNHMSRAAEPILIGLGGDAA
jgi:hypothetical protein